MMNTRTSYIKIDVKYSILRQVVIITDCIDTSFNEMHQTLLNELNFYGVDQINIEPLVPIKNFSVINAAFNIRLFSEIYPPESTIFIVVVHGVRSDPKRIFGKTKNGLTFVGNNSGYFNWLIKDVGLKCLYENKITRKVDGQSFGGKYVQIPTAAKIIAGVSLDEIGIRKSKSFLKDYSIPHGTVVHIDNFGLMKIKAPKLEAFSEGDKLKVYVNGQYKITAIYSEKIKKQEDGTWVLFTGSSLYGLPELGRVRSQNSAKELDIIEGDIITWEKIK